MEQIPTLVIMNYATGIVSIEQGPKIDVRQSEDVEEYISEELGMRLGDVYYMVTYERHPIEYLD